MHLLAVLYVRGNCSYPNGRTNLAGVSENGALGVSEAARNFN